LIDIMVAVADIGSIKAGNFGWVIDHPRNGRSQGSDIDVFADGLISALKAGEKVALGFEAPMFVPVRDQALRVANARIGEGNRRRGRDRDTCDRAGSDTLQLSKTQLSWHRYAPPEV